MFENIATVNFDINKYNLINDVVSKEGEVLNVSLKLLYLYIFKV